MANNEIKIQVKKIDTSTLDQVGEAGKRAGKEAGAGLERGIKEGEQGAKKALDGVEEKLGKIPDKAKQSGGEAGAGLAEGLHGGLKDALSSGDVGATVGGAFEGLKGGGGVVAAAGVGIGLALMDGISRQIEETKIGGLLAAQTGATGQAAAQLGDTAGEVFTDNFGDSIEAVGDAMRAVFNNKLIDVSASKEQIKQVTEAAMTSAQVVGEDVATIARAAQQLVRTGLAGSVTEALDMINHASQAGLNASEDLIDTTTEYATKFRDLGLSGQEAFGLIRQAVDAGARDTDTAADALKEFAIRAQDGSATTARGFANIGLEARTMGAMIAGGGQSAHQALELTLSSLSRIHDPLARDQAAVDLFGTKAEDLGDALFKMDLDSASARFGEFAGATDDAAKKITEATPAIETAWKNIQAGVSNALDFIANNDKPNQMIDEMRKKYEEANRPIEEHKQRVQEAADAWKTQGGEIHHVIESLDEFIAKQDKLAGGVLDLSDAEIAYQKAVDDTAEALKKNGKTLDLNTQKGRDNQSTLNDQARAAFDQIAAMEQQGASIDELSGFMQTARDQFIDMAVKMGMNRDQAQQLADRLRLIPGTYTAEARLNANQALNMIETVHGRLIDLTNRAYVASVSVTQKSMGGKMFVGYQHGGVVGHAAEGGPRSGGTLLAERGFELVEGPQIRDLPVGSTVHSHGDSVRMLAAASGGGDWRLRWEVGPGADTAVGALIHRLLRQGDVQLVARNGDSEYVVTGA